MSVIIPSQFCTCECEEDWALIDQVISGRKCRLKRSIASNRQLLAPCDLSRGDNRDVGLIGLGLDSDVSGVVRIGQATLNASHPGRRLILSGSRPVGSSGPVVGTSYFHMKKSPFGKASCLFSLAALLVSCDRQENPKGDSGKSTSTTEQAHNAAYSDWYSKAGLQFEMERLKPSQFFSSVQGRLHEGAHQYRAITETLDAERYDRYAVAWGQTESELFENEISLLRGGFSRHDSQVFTNSAGVVIHQLVMLRAVGAGGTEAVPLVDVKPERDPIARLEPEPSDLTFESEEENLSTVGEEITPPESEPIVAPEPEPVVEPEPKMKTYVVLKGDTLSSIARRNKVSLSDFKRVNGLESDRIRIKQVLKIPNK